MFCSLYLEALEMINDYWNKDISDRDHAEELFQIISIFPDPLIDMLMDFIFRMRWNAHLDRPELFEELMDVYDFKHSALSLIHFYQTIGRESSPIPFLLSAVIYKIS